MKRLENCEGRQYTEYSLEHMREERLKRSCRAPLVITFAT